MTGDFWIGIGVSIPVSVGCTLASQYIEQAIARRRSAAATEHYRLKNRYETVTYYALHTDMLIARMVNTLLWLFLYAFAILIPKLLEPVLLDALQSFKVSGNHHSFGHVVMIVFTIIAVGSCSACTVFIFRFVVQVSTIYWDVRTFRSFVKGIPNDLRDLQREASIINNGTRSQPYEFQS